MANSLLCSKHFESECCALEGSRYQDCVGIPAKKCIKPDAVPTIFPRSIHGGSSAPSAISHRATSEKWQQKAMSNTQDVSTTIHTYVYNIPWV